MPATQPQTTPKRTRRGLRALVAATAVSSAGDGAFIAAAPLAAAAITRSPTAVALVAAAEYLPWVVVAPFAGYYVDRWPKRTTMIVADLVRSALVAVLAVLVAAGHASITVIALCAFAIVAGNVFHSAAAEATLADLTAADDQLLNRYNGHQQAAFTGGRQLLGPPLGSVSFSLVKWAPFVFDAISFILSAALLLLVPSAPRRTARPDGLWRSLGRSARYLLKHRDLRALAVMTAAGNLSINMVLGVLVLYATDPGGLAITVAGYGFLLVAMAVGGIVGSLAAPWVITRIGNRNTVFVSLAAQGVAWLTIAATGQPVIAGVAIAFAFAGVSQVSVVVMTARQTKVPPESLGQIISAFRLIGNGPAPVGALAGGAIAGSVGLHAPLIVATLIILFAILIGTRTTLSNDS